MSVDLENGGADEEVTHGQYDDDDDLQHTEWAHTPYTDHNTIDFGSIAIYMPALQVVATLFASCIVALVACWVLPTTAVSSIRTAALCAITSIAALRQPLRLMAARGVDAIFDTVRPAAVIYLLALVIEQLGHSCSAPSTQSTAIFRLWLYHGSTLVMVGAGFARAARPKRDADYPFFATCLALGLVAIAPPIASSVGGPLCEAVYGLEAVERIFRAMLFGGAYCVMAYADEPKQHTINDVALSVFRATAASVWVLCVTGYLLPLVVVFIAVAMYARMRNNNGTYAFSGFVPFHEGNEQRVSLHDGMSSEDESVPACTRGGDSVNVRRHGFDTFMGEEEEDEHTAAAVTTRQGTRSEDGSVDGRGQTTRVPQILPPPKPPQSQSVHQLLMRQGMQQWAATAHSTLSPPQQPLLQPPQQPPSPPSQPLVAARACSNSCATRVLVPTQNVASDSSTERTIPIRRNAASITTNRASGTTASRGGAFRLTCLHGNDMQNTSESQRDFGARVERSLGPDK